MHKGTFQKIITLQFIIILILVIFPINNSAPFLTVSVEGEAEEIFIIDICGNEVELKGNNILDIWDECEGSLKLMNAQRQILSEGTYLTHSVRILVIFQKLDNSYISKVAYDSNY